MALATPFLRTMEIESRTREPDIPGALAAGVQLQQGLENIKASQLQREQAEAALARQEAKRQATKQAFNKKSGTLDYDALAEAYLGLGDYEGASQIQQDKMAKKKVAEQLETAEIDQQRKKTKQVGNLAASVLSHPTEEARVKAFQGLPEDQKQALGGQYDPERLNTLKYQAAGTKAVLDEEYRNRTMDLRERQQDLAREKLNLARDKLEQAKKEFEAELGEPISSEVKNRRAAEARIKADDDLGSAWGGLSRQERDVAKVYVADLALMLQKQAARNGKQLTDAEAINMATKSFKAQITEPPMEFFGIPIPFTGGGLDMAKVFNDESPSKKTYTREELKANAKRAGISEDELRKRLADRGWELEE